MSNQPPAHSLSPLPGSETIQLIHISPYLMPPILSSLTRPSPQEGVFKELQARKWFPRCNVSSANPAQCRLRARRDVVGGLDVCMFIQVSVFVCICVCVCVDGNVCMCLCPSAWVCVCMCVWMYVPLSLCRLCSEMITLLTTKPLSLHSMVTVGLHEQWHETQNHNLWFCFWPLPQRAASPGG